jgi:hypothetical protein
MLLVKINCPECKSDIDVDSNFCLNCGFTIKPFRTTTKQNENQVYRSKYSDTSISKQVQNPLLTTIQIIAVLEIFLGFIFALGAIIVSWIYYFMGYALEYGKTIESLPFEYLNILEGLLINLDLIMILIFTFTFVYGIFCVLFGFGLYFFKNWGKKGTLFLSGIGLLFFPIGTVAGGVVIYYLTKKDIATLFR